VLDCFAISDFFVFEGDIDLDWRCTPPCICNSYVDDFGQT